MADYPLAYLSHGKLHLPDGKGGQRILESEFGRSLRQRAAQIHNRQLWKTQGSGARFIAGGRCGGDECDPGEFPITLTSVTRGRRPGEVLYSLETNDISGVFAVTPGGTEQRLFHTSDFRVRDLAAHPDGTLIAASVQHAAQIANIALLNSEGSDFHEISDGDSLDQLPRWAPGPGYRLLFQSAGAGRNAAGRLTGRGPFTIQQLDIDTRDLTCLAEDPAADLLAPQMAEDGTLYYVRRPYSNEAPKVSVFAAVRDAVLFPFRVVYGVMKFFAMIAAMQKGQRPPATDADAENTMRVLGETIALEKTGKDKPRREPEGASLVPSTWELVRQSPDGEKEVLAKGVSSFDLAPDGSVMFSGGRAIHRIEPAGARKERLLLGDRIEQLAAL